MSAETDPQVAEALSQMQQCLSGLEDLQHRANTESFTATDEAETVTVAVNADRWLTGLLIEPGLLRLGAEMVKQRINEALHKAQAAAIAAASTNGQELDETLAALVGGLQQQLGDLLPRPQ
jgi:DNA-binding protein YbaB